MAYRGQRATPDAADITGPLDFQVLDAIRPLRQSARNEVITSLLARCRVPGYLAGATTDRAMMMDKRGEGVLIVLERTQALAGRAPEYRMIDGEELQLSIPAASVEGGK